MVVVQTTDGIKVTAFLRRSAPPLVACLPMVVAVLVARRLMSHLPWPAHGSHLVVEILTGAAAYVAVAPFVARVAAQDILGLLRLTLRYHVSGASATSSGDVDA